MKKQIFSLLVILMFSTQLSFGKDPEWLVKMKSVKLLSSNRHDVIKLFGQPKKSKLDYVEFFSIKGGRISVTYSRGKCLTQIIDGKENILDWNIPKETIVAIGFSPDKTINPKTLKIDFTGFEESSPFKDFITTNYENTELGIHYVLYKGKIELVYFFPPKTKKYLQCNQ